MKIYPQNNKLNKPIVTNSSKGETFIGLVKMLRQFHDLDITDNEIDGLLNTIEGKEVGTRIFNSLNKKGFVTDQKVSPIYQNIYNRLKDEVSIELNFYVSDT